MALLMWKHTSLWMLRLLATVEKATGNFSKTNVIGEGAFGIVYELTVCRVSYRMIILWPEDYLGERSP